MLRLTHTDGLLKIHNPPITVIDNVTSPDYSFATSTSTAKGNWSFILQVTDRTQATMNSTATTVTVNAALQPKFNETLIIAPLTVVVLVALGAGLLVYHKKHKHNLVKKP